MCDYNNRGWGGARYAKRRYAQMRGKNDANIEEITADLGFVFHAKVN